MQQIWNRNKGPIIFFLIVLIVSAFILITHQKASLHLCINSFHSPIFDQFFAYLTHVGDGIFIIILAVVLSYFSFRNSLVVFISFLFSGFIVQIMKRLVFPSTKRPIVYFGEDVLHLVEGVKMLSYKTFPSGHATSALALGFSLMLITKNPVLKFTFLVLSILVAFSRVYLSQHFLVDIFVGAIIGSLSSIYIYYMLQRSEKAWLNSSLHNILMRK